MHESLTKQLYFSCLLATVITYSVPTASGAPGHAHTTHLLPDVHRYTESAQQQTVRPEARCWARKLLQFQRCNQMALVSCIQMFPTEGLKVFCLIVKRKLNVASQSSTFGSFIYLVLQVARLSGPVPPEAPGSKVTAVSEVGVGEHGVFLPHRAEAFDRVHELLVVHEL